MRHRKNTFKLGMRPSHRNAVVANQVASLILHGKIKTTLEKAKGVKRIAERMVTIAKKGDLHHRRIAISKIHDNQAVSRLFSDIAPKFTNRNGGYTRIIKLGSRRGDAAEVCLLQWVEQEIIKKKPRKKSAAKAESKDQELKSDNSQPVSEEVSAAEKPKEEQASAQA